MIVVGIDPSLTGTGLAYSGESEKILTPSASTIRGQLQRMNTIAARVARHVEPGTLVVMEGPALGVKGAWRHVVAGLWWILAATIVSRGATLIEVPPKTLKKFATGNGNADKRAMRDAWRWHTRQDVADPDRVDALWLREVGLQLVESDDALILEPEQVAALDGLRCQLPTSGV